MALLVSEAIVLHAFDYLESSRIVRLLTRDAGLRSALAKGARKSRRRFDSGLDSFAQGTAHLYMKVGRELDTFAAFEDARARPDLAGNLERFTGAEAVAEITLRFGKDGADAELFDAVARSLDALAAASSGEAREVAIASLWRLIAALGFAPAMTECAECGAALPPDAAATFTHSAGGVLCSRCMILSPRGRTIPPAARLAIASWLSGERSAPLGAADARAHQRLLHEFLTFHLHDGRELRAYELWQRSTVTLNGR